MSSLTHQNDGCVLVKPWGTEKHVFSAKTKNVFSGFVFGGERLGLKPCILQCFRMMFRVKKHILFGPSLAPPDTKTERARVVKILEVSFLNPKNVQDN